jgi:hypothetical protein
MLALRAGKHVYTQKPLARTVGEVRAHHGRGGAAAEADATQMGNQGHAGEGIRQIREIVEAGHIGNVQRVEFWTNRPIWPQAINRPTDMHNVPPTFDWNLWLGPAAERPFHPGYAHFNWRGWWDFGTGAMGDMACHIMDAPFWVLGLRYPTRVMPESTALFAETAPKMSRITYEFPAANGRGPVTLTWRDGSIYPPRPSEYGPDRPWVPDADGGQLWIGDKGTLIAGTYGQDPQLCDPVKQAALAKAMPAKKYPRTEGVYKELTSAIRAGDAAGIELRRICRAAHRDDRVRQPGRAFGADDRPRHDVGCAQDDGDSAGVDPPHVSERLDAVAPRPIPVDVPAPGRRTVSRPPPRIFPTRAIATAPRERRRGRATHATAGRCHPGRR